MVSTFNGFFHLKTNDCRSWCRDTLWFYQSFGSKAVSFWHSANLQWGELIKQMTWSGLRVPRFLLTDTFLVESKVVRVLEVWSSISSLPSSSKRRKYFGTHIKTSWWFCSSKQTWLRVFRTEAGDPPPGLMSCPFHTGSGVFVWHPGFAGSLGVWFGKGGNKRRLKWLPSSPGMNGYMMVAMNNLHLRSSLGVWWIAHDCR